MPLYLDVSNLGKMTEQQFTVAYSGTYLSHPIFGNLHFQESRKDSDFLAHFFDVFESTEITLTYKKIDNRRFIVRCVLRCLAFHPENLFHCLLSLCHAKIPNLRNWDLHVHVIGVHPASFSYKWPEIHQARYVSETGIFHFMPSTFFLELTCDLLEFQHRKYRVFQYADFLHCILFFQQIGLQRFEVQMNITIFDQQQQTLFAGPIISNSSLFWKFCGPFMWECTVMTIYLQSHLMYNAPSKTTVIPTFTFESDPQLFRQQFQKTHSAVQSFLAKIIGVSLFFNQFLSSSKHVTTSSVEQAYLHYSLRFLLDTQEKEFFYDSSLLPSIHQLSLLYCKKRNKDYVAKQEAVYHWNSMLQLLYTSIWKQFEGFSFDKTVHARLHHHEKELFLHKLSLLTIAKCVVK